MFSLIVTIIAIALVAALALATLYYGSDAFLQSGTRARASEIVLQGQQVMGAAELFNVDHGRWPDDLQELVNKGYLREIPRRHTAMPSAHATEEPALLWEAPLRGKPLYVLHQNDPEVCRTINTINFKVDGVFNKLIRNGASQCYGPQPGVFDAVVTKHTDLLVELVNLENVIEVFPPNTTDPGWVLPPSSPPPLVCPTTVIGQSSVRTVTLTNYTNIPLDCPYPVTLSGDDTFSVVSSNCGGTLAPGASCTTDVRFTPTGPGTFYSTLSLEATNGTVLSAALQGSGAPVPAGAAPTPGADPAFKNGSGQTLSNLTFGYVAPGTTSAPVTFQVTNTDNTDWTFGDQAVTVPPGYTVTDSTCPRVKLNPGESCSVTIVLSPTETTVYRVEDVLTVGPCTCGPHTHTLPLVVEGAPSGGGQATPSDSEVVLSAPRLDFGQRAVNSVTAATVTLTNQGGTSSAFTAPPGTTGSAAFSLQATTCGAHLLAGAQCSITVAFSPTDLPPASGTLQWKLDGQDYSVPLTGSGASAVLEFQASGQRVTSVEFGATGIGNTASYVLTLANVGNGELKFVGPLSTSAPFSVATSTCTNALIPAGGTCTATISFAPAAIQSYAGSLAFTINGVGGVQQFPLYGSGVKANDVTPVVAVPSSSYGTYMQFATAPDGSAVYVNHYNDKILQKYTASGELLSQVNLAISGCSGGYNPGDIATDSTGAVHISYLCSTYNTTSVLAKYTPDLQFTGKTRALVLGDRVQRLVTNPSTDKVGLITWNVVNGVRYYNIERVPSDYSNLGVVRTSYETHSVSRAAGLMDTNGNFTALLKYDNSVKTYTEQLFFGGKAVTMTDEWFEWFKSPRTGIVYVLKSTTNPTTYTLARFTGGLSVIYSGPSQMTDVTIDLNGCLWSKRSEGISRSTTCDF